MAKLTTVVLTREKSEKLKNCLKSLKQLETDLVVLIGSIKKNSQTEKLAKTYKAEIYKHKLNGDFAAHRNYILDKIKSEWIFYIDDDEVVTEDLANFLNSNIIAEGNRSQIETKMTDEEEIVAYAIPRKNIIFGKEFKHSGQWPDYVIRIFKTKKLKGYKGKVHEQPIFDGDLKHLDCPLIHYKHDQIFEMVEKTNNWSKIEANLMFKANHPPMNIIRFCSAMGREFWHRMIMEKAFLDGSEGIIYAIYQVYSKFISYAKLWEMQINSK